MATQDDLLNPVLYKKNLFRAYKKVFSGTIKESFLIEMHERIEKNPLYGAILLGKLNPDSIFSIERLVRGESHTSISTCKMIVMQHYMNTVSMTEYERGKTQENNSYKERLTDEVVQMYCLERIAAPNFSNSSLEAFLPIIYYASAVNNFCASKYEEFLSQKIPVKAPYNNDFNLKMLYKLIMKIKACINLADIGATDELIVIFRSLIELFMTFAALWDQESSVINSYYDFEEATFAYNYGKEIPSHIQIMANDIGANLISFVNYGWIKNLKEFSNITNKKKSFSLSGLSKILNIKYSYINEEFGTDLYKFYKGCNPQTHGTTMMMNYFELELHIFSNIAVMLEFISDVMSKGLFDFNFMFGNIDLKQTISDVLQKAQKVYEWLNANDKELRRTNSDYRNRFICSMKLRGQN